MPVNYDSIAIYVTKEEIDNLANLCNKIPGLSCLVNPNRSYGTVLEEEIYAADLVYYRVKKTEGD